MTSSGSPLPPGDAVPESAQRLKLVEQAEVALADAVQDEVAKRTEPVVRAYDHHVALGGEGGAVVPAEQTAAAAETAAMEEDQDRPEARCRPRER
ncbi:hypothetical protein GCM10018787_01520 [Streptomyces thermodiastaticus]|nr:hypothetical protein GCM10018787_01520 [Streptomyces thermodiastaticus]